MPNNILALDTTLPHTSAWLRFNGQERHFEALCSQGASETVFSWLKEINTQFPGIWEELDCYALNIGPGRFNGVRLGLSIIGSLMAVYPHPIHTCSTFNLMRATKPQADISTYAVYAKKGHAYVQHSGSNHSSLEKLESLQSETLCTLQCDTIAAAHSLNFIPISTIEQLIILNQTCCHLSFETVVPVYTTLI